jgi:hypothetical protein
MKVVVHEAHPPRRGSTPRRLARAQDPLVLSRLSGARRPQHLGCSGTSGSLAGSRCTACRRAIPSSTRRLSSSNRPTEAGLPPTPATQEREELRAPPRRRLGLAPSVLSEALCPRRPRTQTYAWNPQSCNGVLFGHVRGTATLGTLRFGRPTPVGPLCHRLTNVGAPAGHFAHALSETFS